MVGAELNDLHKITDLRIYQAPVHIDPYERCNTNTNSSLNKTKITSLCYSYFRCTQNYIIKLIFIYLSFLEIINVN